MSKHIIALLLFFLPFSAIAQQRPGSPGQKTRNFNDRPAVGTITAIISDSLSGEVLPFATISLHVRPNDSLVGGAMADAKGRISIKEVRASRYTVKANFLGYKEKVIKGVMVNPRNPIVDLGKIQLSSSNVKLNEAEVKAKRSFMTVDIDRKTYDVTKNIVSEGGSATEVLDNIPSVDVDIEGNVSLRGSGNVRILIDGKPSGLTGASRQAILEQIPAASIDVIEVITNPSAKYDPEGTAGIINIKLKKNLASGFNGSVNAGAGTWYKYNGGVELNYRTEKFNIFSNFSARTNDSWFVGKSFRENIFADTTYFLDEQSSRVRQRQNAVAKAGIDYFITPKSSMTLSGVYGTGPHGGLRNTIYKQFAEDSSLQSVSAVTSFNRESNENVDLNFYFDQHFDMEKKQKLVVEASMSYNTEEERTDLLNWSVGNDIGFNQNFAANEEPQSRYLYLVQADYEQKLGEKGKLETGLKSTITDMDQPFNYFDEVADDLVYDSIRSNHFIYDEDIHAAYLILGGKSSWIQYQVGLRGEMAFTTSQLAGDTTTWENNYNSLYPSVHLSKELGKEEEIMLSYSRRVNRPRTRSLNPFQDFSNPLNVRVGNPYLRPEYISSYEIGHSKRWDNGMSITSSIYYKYTTDVIRRFKTVDETTGVATLTSQNLDNAQNLGAEILIMLRPWKWWNIQASGNGYQTWVNAENLQANLNASGLGLSGKFNNQITFSKKWEAQVSSRFRAPGVTTQGSFKGYVTTDIALKYVFTDRRGSISLRLSDAFDQRRFAYYSEGPSFTSDGVFKRQSRTLNINASYRFGKQQQKMRRQRKGSYGGGDEGMEE